MCNIFARYSLPKQIISDNGPPFQSAEIKEFLRQNCIQNVLISPYHPSSNGLAERFVQTFKYSLESSASDPACTLQQKIQNFLLSYRSTQHATMAHPQPKFSYTMTGMLSSEKSLLTTQSLHTTTCQGKSGNLEPWYNTPHPHSYWVHLDDGRVCRRHVDNILRNNSHSKTTESNAPPLETATPVVPDPRPVITPETSSHPPDN